MNTPSPQTLKRTYTLLTYDANNDQTTLRMTCESDNEYDIYNVRSGHTPNAEANFESSNSKRLKTSHSIELNEFRLNGIETNIQINHNHTHDTESNDGIRKETFIDELGFTITRAVDPPGPEITAKVNDLEKVDYQEEGDDGEEEESSVEKKS